MESQGLEPRLIHRTSNSKTRRNRNTLIINDILVLRAAFMQHVKLG